LLEKKNLKAFLFPLAGRKCKTFYFRAKYFFRL